MTDASTAEGSSIPPAPLPAPLLTDELEIREVMRASHELERSEVETQANGVGKDESVVGLKFLTSIMKATIFTDLFCYHADIRFAHPSQQERIAAMQAVHPRYYAIARNCDFIARGLLMIVITSVVATAAVGTVVKLFVL